MWQNLSGIPLCFVAAPYQAFCEFVDNSIQATGNNSAKGLERKIQLHIFPKEVGCFFSITYLFIYIYIYSYFQIALK